MKTSTHSLLIRAKMTVTTGLRQKIYLTPRNIFLISGKIRDNYESGIPTLYLHIT
jgi:ABC-type bacteriocin/lantibiotic exporter with double-glycine peptidase domain